MTKRQVPWFVRAGLVAAAYMALTFAFAPVSYGMIQFRVSEILNLLAFYNPVYIPGIVLGCALANLNSPLGMIDVVVGSFHTLVSLLFMAKMKNKWVGSLGPTIFSFIIGLEIAYVSNDWNLVLPVTLSVALSEFVICTLVSVPVYSQLEKNHAVRDRVLRHD